jgi:HEAT repeat protein
MTDAAAAVRWLLEQAEPEARRVAVHQIAKVHGREAPELLLRALADDDWRVRKEGTLVAASLERREEVVASLVAAMEDVVNIGLRNAAVEALVAIGPDAVGAILEAFGRLDADARKLAVEVLGGVADARGTAALVRLLSDEDPNVRVTAAEALGNASLAGEDSRTVAITALLAEVAASDPFLRIAVFDSLGRLDARVPWSVFEPYVDDPILRRHAIAAAARAPEPAAIRVLATATGDPSPTIAREAIVALGDLVIASTTEPEVLERARQALAGCEAGKDALRRAARDAEDTRARGSALLVLGMLGRVADVALVVEALGDDDVAERAGLALDRFGLDALATLVEAARQSKASVRAAALNRLATLDGAPVSVVRKTLRQALADTSVEVVVSAVEALGPLGEAKDLRKIAAWVWHADARVAAASTNAASELAARHVSAARALLRAPRPKHDPLVLACILLGAIGSTQPLRDDDVRVLQRALAHDEAHVRRAAVDALSQGGGDAAADAIVFALADEAHEVRVAAVRALGRLGRAEPLAGVVGTTSDPVVTATALRALGEADPERALAAARPLLGHSDAAIACAAVEAIGQMATRRTSKRPPAHVVAACEDSLFAALDHPNGEVVKLSLALVAAQPGPRALARLGSCLDHPSWEVRRIAAELLGQDSSAGARDLLRASYERERDPVVREAIASATSMRPAPDSSGLLERESSSVPGSREPREGEASR